MKATNETTRRGFTLIELLVVIAIIIGLVAIAVPTIVNVMQSGMRSATLSTINMLDGAVQMYESDFNDYPVYPTWDDEHGSPKGLCLLLTGYADDPSPKGAPGDDLHLDDGKDGFGYRVERRQIPPYGPYNGTEKLETTEDKFPSFVDSYGNVIEYRRFAGGSYGGSWDKRVKNTEGQWFRTDFILASPGSDEEFQVVSDEPDTDDITNFLNED
ncbi:MAG: type II secretion system protein [Phycisphaerae bacterium]